MKKQVWGAVILGVFLSVSTVANGGVIGMTSLNSPEQILLCLKRELSKEKIRFYSVPISAEQYPLVYRLILVSTSEKHEIAIVKRFHDSFMSIGYAKNSPRDLAAKLSVCTEYKEDIKHDIQSL